MVASRATAKLRTFIVGDALYDVEMSIPYDMAEAPVTYTVGWGGKSKLLFHGPNVGYHFDVLLAALDHLEECGELDLEQATLPVDQIQEV